MQPIIEKVKSNSTEISFQEIIEFIDKNYNFNPTRFKNGDTINEAGQNSGSCRLFSFAKMHEFNKDETLNCFGDYYRKDVLENPEGTDHQNIRNFIKYGWEGILFDGQALNQK